METLDENDIFNSRNPVVIQDNVYAKKGYNYKLLERKDEPEIDIVIHNIISIFSVRCHLDLRTIALNGSNVKYRKERGVVIMKLRKPHTTASIRSSGRIVCMGANNEDMAKIASRKYARILQRLGFPVHFSGYKIVNIFATCKMPFGINIVEFVKKHKKHASYEPELNPAVIYKIDELKATIQIFSTGSITVMAPSVTNIQAAIESIYPLIYVYKNDSNYRKQ